MFSDQATRDRPVTFLDAPARDEERDDRGQDVHVALLARVVARLDELATSGRRRELVRDARAVLDRMGRDGLLEGLTSVEAFGSFASDAEEPADIDLMLQFEDPERGAEVAEELGTVSEWKDGRVSIAVIEAGPDGDAFRDEYRTETMRRYAVPTVRIV